MMGRNVVQAAVGAALGVVLAACNPIAVKTDAGPGLSTASCHTYAFANEHMANADQPAAYANPINAERLRVAVQNNLAAKGLQPASNQAADCVVGYALGSRQVFDDYYGGLGAWGGWGGGGWGRGRWGWGGGFYDGPWPENQVRIAVDLFDNRTHKPIWHASATQDSYELSGAHAEERINAAATAIFTKFPLMAGGSAT